LVAEQTLYNLLERRAELEVIPACLEYGLGLIPWSPLAGGLLAGPPTTEGRRMAALENASEKVKSQLGRFEQLSSGLGEPSSNVALAWLLHQPAIASVITGPGDANQLSEMLKVPDIELSHDVLAQIDEIFPPCGPAPEAYAW
jgi:aryl-alcohol dehydrogenase-like predicted oxidoreductase